MSTVRLEKVCKAFGDVPVVRDVSLDLPTGSLTVFLGPSGCGKTTTLRMLAGLESVSSGRIYIGDNDVTDLDPRDRNIAMVFQNYALYPHKTVAENMAFGLRVRKVDPAEIERRIRTASQLLGLSQLLERRPRQLSGGQMQRVALGRALVRDAEVFLLDEPLSNLDAKLRVQMREEIYKLQRRLGKSMVYVTHDQVEAMTLADQIAIMRDGQVQQVASPLEIFDKPVNLYVATFIGTPEMNILTMRREGNRLLAPGLSVQPGGPLPAVKDGVPVKVGIRPDHVQLAVNESDASAWLTVDVCEQLGTTTLLSGQLGEQRFRALLPRTQARVGDRLPIHLLSEHFHFFDAETGLRLDDHRPTGP
ncbi:ABC transporter ATP-binding protein [Caenimonas sp. SL110]|uniref:ABC transporter ATP-binding protein n=1 Tax=Caenimonas sp. SL110 TaxID=1450524 RepID=UPI0006543A45|nr:sn-glycerol-3-phosphate ABC transporter ATP-binding protein UgpC [Caenimonas sp. SL110]